MSLRDYVIATRTVPLAADNKMSVRGLGFDDIQHLLINRSGLVDEALEIFGVDGFDLDSLTPEQQRGFAGKMIAKLPLLAAELIALGADEPDLGETARRLPAPVQLEALMAVYELTFTEPGSVKNFFDRLADLMKSIPKKTGGAVDLASLRAGLSASGVTLAS